jgi:hypothetical protein
MQVVGRLDAGENTVHRLCFRAGSVVTRPGKPQGGGYIAGPPPPSQGFSRVFSAQIRLLGLPFRRRMPLKEKAFAIILGTG